MTENEYTIIRTIKSLEMAQSALRDIVPEFCQIISGYDLKDMRKTMAIWVEQLYDLIEIETDNE